MNIPEEAVTAAQDAYWEGVEEARENGTESVGHYLGMKAALSAAAPYLMAMAWDEGWNAGYDDRVVSIDDFDEPYSTNPYRKESL